MGRPAARCGLAPPAATRWQTAAKDGAGRRKRGDDVRTVSAADFRAQLIYVQRYNILSLRPNVWAFLGAQCPKGPRRRHHQRRGAQARHGGGLTAHRQSRRPRFVKFSPNARQAAQLPGGQRIAKQGILPRKTFSFFYIKKKKKREGNKKKNLWGGGGGHLPTKSPSFLLGVAPPPPSPPAGGGEGTRPPPPLSGARQGQ